MKHVHIGNKLHTKVRIQCDGHNEMPKEALIRITEYDVGQWNSPRDVHPPSTAARSIEDVGIRTTIGSMPPFCFGAPYITILSRVWHAR